VVIQSRKRKIVIVANIVIDGLVYLKLTPVVIQSRNAAKMNGSQPDWDAREKLGESNARP
jgi:hypothetical protein